MLGSVLYFSAPLIQKYEGGCIVLLSVFPRSSQSPKLLLVFDKLPLLIHNAFVSVWQITPVDSYQKGVWCFDLCFTHPPHCPHCLPQPLSLLLLPVLKEVLELLHGLKQLAHEALGVSGGLGSLRGHMEKDAAVTWHHVWHPVAIVWHRSKPTTRWQLPTDIKWWQIERQTGRQTERQTDRQIDRQAGRHTGRQAGR